MKQLQTNSEICFEMTAQIIAAYEKGRVRKLPWPLLSQCCHNRRKQSRDPQYKNSCPILPTWNLAVSYKLTPIYKSIKIFLFKTQVFWVQLKYTVNNPQVTEATPVHHEITQNQNLTLYKWNLCKTDKEKKEKKKRGFNAFKASVGRKMILDMEMLVGNNVPH